MNFDKLYITKNKMNFLYTEETTYYLGIGKKFPQLQFFFYRNVNF